MRLINAESLEWDLMGMIWTIERLISTGQHADDIAYAKLNSYKGFLERVKAEKTVDAISLGTGNEYRADNFDIVKKRCEADPEVEVFTIARKEESNPAPDCPWR